MNKELERLKERYFQFKFELGDEHPDTKQARTEYYAHIKEIKL